MIRFIEKIICDKCGDSLVLFNKSDTTGYDNFYRLGFEDNFLYFYSMLKTKSYNYLISNLGIEIDYKSPENTAVYLYDFGFKINMYDLENDCWGHSCEKCCIKFNKDLTIKGIIN